MNKQHATKKDNFILPGLIRNAERIVVYMPTMQFVRERIARAARQEGQSPSDFLRSLILNEVRRIEIEHGLTVAELRGDDS